MVRIWGIGRCPSFLVVRRGVEWSLVIVLEVPVRYLGIGIKENDRGQDGRLIMQESLRVDMLRGRDGTGLATGD